MDFLDIIGQVFWFGILATPLIGFLIVRRWEIKPGLKILSAIVIAIFLSVFFYLIAIAIVLRDGLGPG